MWLGNEEGVEGHLAVCEFYVLPQRRAKDYCDG